MKGILFFLISALAFSGQAFAQNAPQPVSAPAYRPVQPGQQGQPGQNGQPGTQVNLVPTNPMDEVTPPIPITRDVVRRVVDYGNAQVMDPTEINSVKRRTSSARIAMLSPYPDNKIATPVHRRLTWSPDHIGDPTKLRLWQGTVTALVFTDMNGNAWNIESVSLNCDLFDDGRSCDSNSGGQGLPQGARGQAASGAAAPTNILSLQSRQQYAYGNVVVRLQGQPTPVIYVLETGMSDKNDMQVDVRVEGRNPNAQPQLMTVDTLPGYDPMMGEFLAGVPPTGAQEMKISGGIAQAWLLNGAIYVRTTVNILSPAFSDHDGSAEGVQVYKYPNASVPNLMASVNGVPTSLVISGN